MMIRVKLFCLKMQINTFYMVAIVQMKDYQLVAKKQGTKSIPPPSSLVLLFTSLVLLLGTTFSSFLVLQEG